MRLVAVADTHAFEEDLTVPDGDVFVHAGDLCRMGEIDELARQLSWMKSLPHRHKVLVAGNHDVAFARRPREARALLGDIVYLQDEGAIVAGLRFWGSPWQPAFHDWSFNLERGEPLRERWALIPRGLDVLVTHGPPAGIGDAGSGMAERLGCDDLRRRVEDVVPRLHLFGHIHQGGGLWRLGETTFANVTTWECERPPTVVDVDVAGVRAVSVPARERVR